MSKDFFKDNDRMNDRHKNKTKEQKAAVWAFRELCWKAIDSNDKDFSIVETAKALGLYK